MYIQLNNVAVPLTNQTKTQIYEEDFSKAAIYSQQKKFYKIIDMLKKHEMQYSLLTQFISFNQITSPNFLLKIPFKGASV